MKLIPDASYSDWLALLDHPNGRLLSDFTATSGYHYGFFRRRNLLSVPCCYNNAMYPVIVYWELRTMLEPAVFPAQSRDLTDEY